MRTLVPVLLFACACPSRKDSAPPPDTQETAPSVDTVDSCECLETGQDTGTDTSPGKDTGDPIPPDTNPPGDTGSPDETGALLDTAHSCGDGGVALEPSAPVPGGSVRIRYQGPLCEHANLSALVGFNGWVDLYEWADFDADYTDGDTWYFLEVPLLPGPDGVPEGTVDLPDDLRALHLRFWDPTTWETDDNDGDAYNYGVRFPYVGPYLTWNAETRPGTGLVVNFATDGETRGRVRYGTTPGLSEVASDDGETRWHHVALTDLEPGQTWYYQVLDEAGHASEVYSFRTPQEDAATLKVVAVSDIQDVGEDEAWPRVLDAIVESHLDADLLLVAGDMPDADVPAQWWIFFDKSRDLLSRVPILPAVGNHDTPGVDSSPDSTHFREIFALPYATDGEPYYALDHGPFRFLSLNSEKPEEWEEGAAQHSFASAELAGCWTDGVRTCEGVFAFWHIPVYNAGYRHYDEGDPMRPLTALFDGTVDWAIGGHEHLGQRFLPIRYDATLAPSGSYGTGPDDGVGYLVLPPGGDYVSDWIVDPEDEGAWLRDLLASPVPAEDASDVASENGFVTLEVDPDGTTVTLWGVGTVLDPLSLYARDSVTVPR